MTSLTSFWTGPKPMTLPSTYHPFRRCIFLVGFLIVMVISSCTGLRNLPEGEKLYTGSNIHLEKEKDIVDDRNVERELSRVLRPAPNSKLLISRPRLWMYQHAGEPTGRGLRHWMRNRLGEEPVLYDDAFMDRNMRLLYNRLYNMGYFDALVEEAKDTTARTVSVDYRVSLRQPYRVRTLFPVDEDSRMAEQVNESLVNSLIVTGDPYSLETMRQERQRIERALKKKGYFYFHPDHLLFRADSAVGDRHVDLHTTIKADIPDAVRKAYLIGNIYIHADYMAGGSNRTTMQDTLQLEGGVYFTDDSEQFDPGVIRRAVLFQKDSLYDVRDHDRSLNHLMSLGTFRFVNIRFRARQEEGRDVLDVRVLLTPTERRSMSAELRGVTKSNNFAGPGLNTTLTNRNVFKGAETLDLSLDGSYEALVGRRRSASSTELGMDATLSFPRFLLPAGWKETPRVLSPKTNISVGANFLSRTDAFQLTTMHARYGYTWNRDLATQLRISPLMFNLFVLGDVDEEMEGVLVEGALLRHGLFEQFILGGQYSYIYNSRLKATDRNDWYVHLNLDLSGNIAYLLLDQVFGASKGEDGGYGLFNQSFAQYAKADGDFRYYWQMGEGHRLVYRLFLGAGLPYGNSEMMPYVKQYVTGGSNSIRAFHPRSVGPGRYVPDEETAGTYNIYQTGEMKLEANVEYRFDITSLFKGALFVDAGNIWRVRDDENVPGGKFSAGTFYEEIAMGAGVGLRIDASFFILRFDFAAPLANPATDSFFDPFRLHKSRWRRDNIVFNLGIGYPF